MKKKISTMARMMKSHAAVMRKGVTAMLGQAAVMRKGVTAMLGQAAVMFVLLAALTLGMPAKAGNVIEVNDFESLRKAFFDGATAQDTIRMTRGINFDNHELGEADYELSVPSGSTRNLDLNGYTLKNTAYTSSHNHVIAMEAHSTLNIYDSRETGSIINRPFSTFGSGTYSYAILMRRSDACTLNIYGGRIMAMDIYGAPAIDGKSIYSQIAGPHAPNTINIYGGIIYGINNSVVGRNKGDSALVINLNGGTLGNEDAYIGIGYSKYFKGTLRNGTIYGLKTGVNAAEKFIASIDPNTKIYVDGIETSKTDFGAMLSSSIDKFLEKKVDFLYEPSIKVAGVAVTNENCNDILGDGRVRFDIATQTLHLASKVNSVETLNGNISFDDVDLTIEVSGDWQINGRIVGFHGDLSLKAHNPKMNISTSDKLLVRHSTVSPISINNGNVTVNEWLQLYVDQNGNHAQSAITCNNIYLNRCLLDVSGSEPVVNAEGSTLTGCSFTIGGDFQFAQEARIEPDVPAGSPVKAWIAGIQLSSNNLSTGMDANDPAIPFQSEHVKGNVYAWFEGPVLILDLRDVEINVRDVATWNGFTGKGVPAVEIQQDSVVVLVQNTLIWSGCPTGKKFDGLDNTYYADGSYGIYFNPTKPNNCEIKLRVVSDREKPCRSLYIGAASDYQTSANPIYCKGSRLYIERVGNMDAQDSIWIQSNHPVKCATGLTLNCVNIYSKKGYTTSNKPSMDGCYISWPRAANFNSTGGVTGSTDNTSEGIMIRNTSQYPLSLFAEVNDGAMGKLWCTQTSCSLEEVAWDEEIPLNCTPNAGYKFKEWRIYRKGKSSVETITNQSTSIQLRSNTRCVAVFETSAGEANTYPLLINGVAITSENCMNPTGDKSSYYNPDRHCLYLNNANWSFTEHSAIVYNGTESFSLQLTGKSLSAGYGVSDHNTNHFACDDAYFFGDTITFKINNDTRTDYVLSGPKRLHLKNKYTEVLSNEFVGIYLDTLIIDEGSELVVTNGRCVVDSIIMPDDYMIYPAGCHIKNGRVVDADGYDAKNILIAPINPKYTITASANNDTFGSVSGDGIYTEGDEVSLSATAKDGYEFVRWSNGSTNNPYLFVACMNMDITAIFQSKSGTSIEQTRTEQIDSSHKFIQNGSLYIEKNGQIYNAQGIKVQ